MSDDSPNVGGPLDDARWPAKLTARVVAPGPRPAIHGYDVEGDLAPNYSLAECVLLALCGELPSAEQARAFEVAVAFLSPAPVNEAPTHAAVITRVCNVLTSAIIGTAALGLAEQARVAVSRHADWLRTLATAEARPDPEAPSPTEPPPPPADDDERRSVQRLREALRRVGVVLSAIEGDVGRPAALLATLWFAGLRRAEQFEAAWALARMPTAVAEALATPSHSYRDYPVLLPAFAYGEKK